MLFIYSGTIFDTTFDIIFLRDITCKRRYSLFVNVIRKMVSKVMSNDAMYPKHGGYMDVWARNPKPIKSVWRVLDQEI